MNSGRGWVIVLVGLALVILGFTPSSASEVHACSSADAALPQLTLAMELDLR
jgi:hypothetical protein